MNETKRKEETQIGRLPRALLALVLPRHRREEFIGDLLEEAEQHQARRGRAFANRWLVLQVLRSWPNLLGARLRGATVARAVPIAVAAAGPSSRSLGGVLWGERATRSWAVSFSVSMHALVLAAALVWGFWHVDEVSPPRVQITFWDKLLPPPQVFGEPAKAAVRKSERATSEKASTRPVRPQAVALKTTPPTGESKDSSGSTEPSSGTNGVGPPGDCPLDSGCTGEGPARVLPPQVADKSCLACELPHLPPAFMRIGTVHDMLVKICVNAEGRVTSATVLRGVSPAADAGVVATLLTWRFSPYAVEGRPVPFCYVSRFVFQTGS
jgi:TonB family protein